MAQTTAQRPLALAEVKTVERPPKYKCWDCGGKGCDLESWAFHHSLEHKHFVTTRAIPKGESQK